MEKITEEQVKNFWNSCFRYGLSKCKLREVSEDFAQEAYIYVFVRNWRMDLRKCWAHFTRTNLGVRGYAKWRFGIGILRQRRLEKQLENRREDIVYYIEDCIADSETERCLILKCLNMKEQMLIILLEAGFTQLEVEESFGHAPECLRKCRHSIQRKCVESQEVEELVEKDTRPLLASLVRQQFVRQERQRRRPAFVSVEVPSLDA